MLAKAAKKQLSCAETSRPGCTVQWSKYWIISVAHHDPCSLILEETTKEPGDAKAMNFDG